MNERIEIGGRKFYWDDIYQFMEWFVGTTGIRSKEIMDGLMSKQWGLVEVGGLDDSIIGNLADILNKLEYDNKELTEECTGLRKTIYNRGETIRVLKDKLGARSDVATLESRLMEAERLLGKIGLSLNYKEQK